MKSPMVILQDDAVAVVVVPAVDCCYYNNRIDFSCRCHRLHALANGDTAR